MRQFASEAEAIQYVVGCKVFKDYKSFEEYKEDIVLCLIYSSWHYSEKEAAECIRDDIDFVREAFKKKICADSCAAEVGYACG